LITSVASSTEQMTDVSQQVQASAGELSRLAEQLQASVQSFRV